MAKVIQYPHYLFIYKASESSQDEDGDWVASEPTLELHSRCREENNGGQLVPLAGGEYARFASLLQCPKGTDGLSPGVAVVVSNDPDGKDVRLSKVVLKSDKAQLHTRIWV